MLHPINDSRLNRVILRRWGRHTGRVTRVRGIFGRQSILFCMSSDTTSPREQWSKHLTPPQPETQSSPPCRAFRSTRCTGLKMAISRPIPLHPRTVRLDVSVTFVDDADVRRFRHHRGHQLAIQRNHQSWGTGLSTAFDMPTLLGLDSDDPMSLGEVGRCGVAVDSLSDMEDLYAESIWARSRPR